MRTGRVVNQIDKCWHQTARKEGLMENRNVAERFWMRCKVLIVWYGLVKRGPLRKGSGEPTNTCFPHKLASIWYKSRIERKEKIVYHSMR